MVSDFRSVGQALVQIRWAQPLATWQIDWKSGDLVGSAIVRAQPRIEKRSDRLEIRDLEPNTLVEFAVRCLDCTPGDLEAARKAAVQVEARGRVLDSEPRTTLFGRALLNAARLGSVLF